MPQPPISATIKHGSSLRCVVPLPTEVILIDDTSMMWFRLRERRVSLRARSKLDESSSRRQTFAAAMAQFEEQLRAAEVVTSATRPLNLYYGLAQAGMAIAAAHAPDPWSFSRHGLHLVDRRAELADMQVEPQSDGGFQRIAAATGSPGITGPVSLGALWASLPQLSGTVVLPGSALPVPLDLLAEELSDMGPRAQLYLPKEMLAEGPGWLERFGEIMSGYPGAMGWMIPASAGAVQAPKETGELWEVTLEWPSPDPTRDLSKQELKAFFDEIAPEYCYRFDRFLRPAIDADSNAVPSPLMTWWLLLYSFSILARYEPRRWMALLDLDKSKAAASLQYALEEALTTVPHLVLEALDGERHLLPKPISF
jgi:hypothetical protein